MVVKDLSKQKALDVDRRAIRQINYTANLDTAGNITMIFNTEEQKNMFFRLSTRNCKIILKCVME